jgi:uncharacterized protein (TIGR03435 family)
MLNRAITFFCSAAILCGQAAPSFEVAIIRPSEHGVMDLQIRGNQLSISRMDMYMLVQFGFRVKPNQYTVPDWAKTTAYDVEAKFAEGATQDQVFDMLQPLLIERFGLRFHRETRERDVYAIVVAKGGIKARELRSDEDPTIVKTATGIFGGKGTMIAPGNRAMTYTATTPASLAQALMDKFDLPVVDRTNLTARYFLQFDDPLPGLLQGQGVSYEDARLQAIQEQLQGQGLRLEKQRAPTEMLIIDHLEKTPTAN